MELLRPIYKNLERYSLSVTLNYNDARELTAETISNAYQNFESIKNEQAFLSYIFTIAHRINIQRYKQIITDDIETIADSYADNSISPDEQYDITVLRNAINKLPDIERDCIILGEINGFKHKEIAEILGISVANVKVKCFRAKNMLRKMLITKIDKIHSFVDSSLGGTES